MIKFEVQETGRTDYPYNVQVWKSLDGGKNFYYTRRGRFCRSMQEVAHYKDIVKEGVTMHTIAVVAQKGGSGKTTTAAVIADYLSKMQRRTLAIDMNDQGDLTDTLGAAATTSGAAAVMNGKPIKEMIVKTNLEGVDILTGADEIALLEQTMKETGKERALKLRKALAEVKNDYDYCVIDAPGSFNSGMLNALLAADDVIIPATPDYFSLRGIKRLIDNIAAVKQSHKALTVSGILLTRYQARRNLSKDVVETLQAAEKTLKTQLFHAKIRENIKIAEAPLHHQTVISYAPASNGAEDYTAFLKEYLKLEGE